MTNSMPQNRSEMQEYISNLAKKKQINDWQYNFYLSEIDRGDLSPSLFADLIVDYDVINKFGIDSEEEWNLWQYVDMYSDSLLEDCYQNKFNKPLSYSLSEKEILSLKAYIFGSREDRNINLRDLKGVCTLINEWIDANISGIDTYVKESCFKTAYPLGDEWREPSPTYSVDRWVNALGQVYRSSVSLGLDRSLAMDRITKDWDQREKEHFLEWAKFYEHGEHKKRDVKAMDDDFLYKDADFDFSIPDFKTEQEIITGFGRWRNALLSRINSALRSPLEHLRGLLKPDDYTLLKNKLVELLAIIYDLQPPTDAKEAKAKMNHIQDHLIRIAGIYGQRGFVKEAKIVGSIARESFEEGILEKFSAESITTILDSLEKIEEELKSRHMIRLLSKADLELAGLGMASYFPELGDAISRLFESYSYSSNKVSEVVSRLRGGEKVRSQQKAKKVQVLDENTPPE